MNKENIMEQSEPRQGRGQLTDRIKTKSVELMGYEISVRELRLMPYIQNCVMNSINIDPAAINAEEREILSLWRGKRYITGGASGLKITKEFWDIINEILFLGYVDLF